MALSRDRHALTDDDITDDIVGQRQVAEHQERLPVQRGGMTLVNALAAGRAGAPTAPVLPNLSIESSEHLGGIA
jgi:hypothetical protein